MGQKLAEARAGRCGAWASAVAERAVVGAKAEEQRSRQSEGVVPVWGSVHARGTGTSAKSPRRQQVIEELEGLGHRGEVEHGITLPLDGRQR